MSYRGRGKPCVYFIQAGDGGPVKIGCAVSPEKRLFALQCGHYLTLTLIRAFPGTKVEESEAHNKFIDAHIRGEWFEFVPEMLTWAPGSEPVKDRGVDFYYRFHGEEKARVIIEKGVTTRRAGAHSIRVWRTA